MVGILQQRFSIHLLNDAKRDMVQEFPLTRYKTDPIKFYVTFIHPNLRRYMCLCINALSLYSIMRHPCKPRMQPCILSVTVQLNGTSNQSWISNHSSYIFYLE